ncbi:MAG: CRISPR-associated protein Csx20 [Clostridium cochlearium]|uniref:Uncharacterized protein n=1 Tax=Clostridium cochlearium TaxID=1494 RepID=A0ABY0QP13_CLOCO|nr:CRISPR-associated protein Csx20 [Clostridium cochlearium]MDU1443549.1 CRISPR-associated protein Csx20 [Clostridium cochlearium]SDL41666.1 hypothetical protein SAMN05216497_1316 [Clostridium cochlearium]
MNKMFLLFSHELTEGQIKEAENRFKIEKFIYLTDELQKLWSNIPPEGELDETYIKEFKDFISSKSEKGDYILIQGEFGMTYNMVQWSFKKGYIPIYASSKRVYKYIQKEDGTIENIHIFKHVNFRRY